ncbi:MAG: TRAP transporter substrate-binding protein [Rhodospirillales bacterium]|nr:TRAP transporter substrate-binding protein [Rhodospirillales bacterium]
MRKYLYGLGATVAAVAMLGMVTAAHAEKVRIAGNFPGDHSSSQAMKIFKEEVEKATKGELTVDLFPDMQLGGAQENIDQVRSGTVFATWISIAFLSRTVPELEAVSLPFVFANRDQAFRVMDGKVGELLDKKLADKGYTSLGYMELGSRNVTNSVRPLKTLEDFKNLKVRLQPNETHIATFRAIGANPVSMDIKEVYSALQQGVLDGQENPYSIIETRRFDEVQKYLSDSGHFFDFIIIAANKRKFEGFKPEVKDAVRAAMAKAISWQRKKAADEDIAARDTLIKRGMQFDAISPEVRAQLTKATSDVVGGLRKKIGSDMIDAVMAEAQK